MLKRVKNTRIGGYLYNYYRIIRDARKVFNDFNIVKDRGYLLKRIMYANRLYDWNPDEYFLYHFEDLSNHERLSFVSEKEHVDVADLMNNDINARKILQDKWSTYLSYKKFFKREACKVFTTNKEDINQFIVLLEKYGKLILKPLDGSFGKGICILESSEDKASIIKRIQKDYPNGFIAEEVIRQNSKMSCLHQESVNTLRVHTICYNGIVKVFHPYVRIGRGKSIVDNAGSGGVFTSCNPESGEILSVVDEFGNSYDVHPDNGFGLTGYIIPYWEDAFKFATELALAVPDIHYAGWDLALTDKGWVLVEGNPRAQFIFQISEQKGFYEELVRILESFGVKYNRQANYEI